MSQKTKWRIDVEALIKQGKTNAEIIEALGNPYQDHSTCRKKLSKIKYEIKRSEQIPQDSVLAEEAKAAGIPLENVNYFWYKNERISINAKNDKTLEELFFEIKQEMREHSPFYPPLTRRAKVSGNMLVIDPADVHIGKLAKAIETGDEYNVSIAVTRVMQGVKALLVYAEYHNIEQIVLTIGGDIMHVDNKRRTTTNGTAQDTDVMWYEQFTFAQKLYVQIIEQLLTVADVHVVHNMSNHDNVMGWCLSQTIEAWFSKCSNVTFDVTPKVSKAFLWGKCLVVFTHGEMKEDKLALLVPHDFRELWSKASFCNVHKQHIHHKTVKDHMSVTIQTSRSVSGADSWHSAQGYSHAPKALECFIYGKETGQFATYTHYFT